MKIWIPIVLTVIVVVIICAACCAITGGIDWFGTAQIVMPDGTVVQGRVDSYRDHSYSDTLQLTIDGVTYLTHAANVVLMKNK